MSTSAPLRRLLTSPVCTSCRHRLQKQSSLPRRTFATSPIRSDEKPTGTDSLTPDASTQISRGPRKYQSTGLPPLEPNQRASTLRQMLGELNTPEPNASLNPLSQTRAPPRTVSFNDLDRAARPPAPSDTEQSLLSLLSGNGYASSSSSSRAPRRSVDDAEYDYYKDSASAFDVFDNPAPHHLHIFATKHNTHMTLTRPDKSPIVSLSAGNIGFRKAQRGSYDAAFQLAAYVMRNIQERGLLRQGGRGMLGGSDEMVDGPGSAKVEAPIRRLEVVWRGYGQGREAVTKALLGNEGRNLRRLVVGVADATRLKFGGTRGMNPRRLG